MSDTSLLTRYPNNYQIQSAWTQDSAQTQRLGITVGLGRRSGLLKSRDKGHSLHYINWAWCRFKNPAESLKPSTIEITGL